MFQYDDIAFALYNIPWLKLKANNRKVLIIVILSCQNPISLSAGGLNDLTFKWFSTLIRSGYDTALVFKKVIGNTK